ncbi:flagellar basal body rod protein FlgC [Limobrevibacterium gyesilva]|uniref:Flagellar basal-body rod protein FlgC n=1 Tax=Limobrevibacterium gyesilva TaxID=2991712 RepID=A0AA42CEC3_9PROT|nr:flagellar basal body rod protein FlgC [Limobrevibacterium gyesilva]MCW3475099.1 flagellar basal body rod protein FlgC [Limobrevibacterium gyesilva]
MDMEKALTISARGMQAQTTRLRIIAENLANQDSTGSSPGAPAYRRKTVTFGNEMDRSLGVEVVKVREIGEDKSDLPLRYDPGHPAADANGYVRTPNVNSFVEVMDMREAQRSYNANVSVMQITRGMLSRTIEMLK